MIIDPGEEVEFLDGADAHVMRALLLTEDCRKLLESRANLRANNQLDEFADETYRELIKAQMSGVLPAMLVKPGDLQIH